jgi:hypothetical protein
MNENRSFDDKLMEAARALGTDITPERDLWPEIESALAKPARNRWNTKLVQAAAVVLLIGASSALTYLAMDNRTLSATPHVNTAPLVIEQASFGDQYMLGPDYQDAREGLKAQLDEELEHLTPAERAEVMKNLEAIRSVIEEINRALTNDPDSALLQELLLSTYQEELSLMMKVGGVTNAAMNRTDF